MTFDVILTDNYQNNDYARLIFFKFELIKLSYICRSKKVYTWL